jgi:Glycosyltransferase family 9 (heptosyltransferase)
VGRVLLLRAGALGDLLLLRPVVASLHGAGSSVVLLAPEASGGCLVGPGPSEVERLIPWDRADVARFFQADAPLPASLADELRACDVVLAYTRNAELGRRLGGSAPKTLLWDPVPPPGTGHAAGHLARPLALLGLHPDLDPPACVPLDPERAVAAAFEARLPRGFMAVHPGSGSPDKNWPGPSFAALVARLALPQAWLLVEGPADTTAAGPLRAHPGVLTAGGLGTRELGALLSRCGLFVGNDSGVSHLAAAFGAPVVALFGPSDPAVWRPLGRRVRIVRSPTSRMADLALDQVESACRAALAEGPALRSAEA